MNNRGTDVMVAEKVMGWKPYRDKWISPDDISLLDLPHYSTDMTAAWRVVEKMQQGGYWAQLRTPFGLTQCNDGYWCGFTPHLATGWNGTPDDWTSAESQPLAICLAALKAVGVEIEDEG